MGGFTIENGPKGLQFCSEQRLVTPAKYRRSGNDYWEVHEAVYTDKNCVSATEIRAAAEWLCKLTEGTLLCNLARKSFAEINQMLAVARANLESAKSGPSAVVRGKAPSNNQVVHEPVRGFSRFAY